MLSSHHSPDNLSFMNLALNEAKKSLNYHEVPVGAVIVYDGKVIAKSGNRSISTKDPTAHAEIIAIRQASKVLDNYRLTGAVLYVTLEPCMMCYGAIIHSRISKIYFGAYDKKTGSRGSCTNAQDLKCFNNKPEINGGILEPECSNLLKDFFKSKRV